MNFAFYGTAEDEMETNLIGQLNLPYIIVIVSDRSLH